MQLIYLYLPFPPYHFQIRHCKFLPILGLSPVNQQPPTKEGKVLSTYFHLSGFTCAHDWLLSLRLMWEGNMLPPCPGKWALAMGGCGIVFGLFICSSILLNLYAGSRRAQSLFQDIWSMSQGTPWTGGKKPLQGTRPHTLRAIW